LGQSYRGRRCVRRLCRPGLPAAQQRSEAERLAAFEQECQFYCTKWGLERGTRGYATCVSDLHQFRTSVVKQLAADDF